MSDDGGEGDSPFQGKASDFAPEDWQKKFDQIKINPVTGTPLHGEYSRVATTIEPTCNPRTLERRFKAKDTSATKLGAPCALGPLEPLLLEWLKDYKSLGVNIYRARVQDKARRLAHEAGIAWDFKASESWLNGFCKRNKLDLREGQFLEAVRRKAVSKEALNRFFDLFEIVQEGVEPENKWMLDEKFIDLDKAGNYKVGPT